MLGFTPQIFLPAIYTGNTLVRVKRYSMCYIATFILGAVKASNFDVCVSCRGENNVNFPGISQTQYSAELMSESGSAALKM